MLEAGMYSSVVTLGKTKKEVIHPHYSWNNTGKLLFLSILPSSSTPILILFLQASILQREEAWIRKAKLVTKLISAQVQKEA